MPTCFAAVFFISQGAARSILLSSSTRFPSLHPPSPYSTFSHLVIYDFCRSSFVQPSYRRPLLYIYTSFLPIGFISLPFLSLQPGAIYEVTKLCPHLCENNCGFTLHFEKSSCFKIELLALLCFEICPLVNLSLILLILRDHVKLTFNYIDPIYNPPQCFHLFPCFLVVAKLNCKLVNPFKKAIFQSKIGREELELIHLSLKTYCTCFYNVTNASSEYGRCEQDGLMAFSEILQGDAKS